MRKLTVSKQHSGYFTCATTSGSTQNIYITDGGKYTLMLEECLIWEDELFDVAEFDLTVRDCLADANDMRACGWVLLTNNS
jgi:hypothetical protein